MSSTGRPSMQSVLLVVVLTVWYASSLLAVVEASSFLEYHRTNSRSVHVLALRNSLGVSFTMPRGAIQHQHQHYQRPTNHHLERLRGGGGGGGVFSRDATKLHLTPTSFGNGPFWEFNQIIAAVNLLGFITSVVSGGSHLHLDLLGTGAFALSAIHTGLASDIPRVQLSAGLVSLWGTKLASFLFWRALQLKHDNRLSTTLSTVTGTATFWFVSLLWGVIASFPHSLGATSSYNIPILKSPCAIVGVILFLLGLLTETTADIQKWIFKANNPGKFCNVGLWSISQHPNWLGNLMLWSGILLLNAPALIDPPPLAGNTTNLLQFLWRFKRLAVAALSPLFLYTLFSGQASGSITNAQELVMTKYGKDPEFRTYQDMVPLIVLNPLKLFQK
jgi:steroid 5-alpha reductase family enzyme